MTKRKDPSDFVVANGYRDEDYIHYVYKIINKKNNKYYIGIHSTLKSLNKSPLNDGYWGSGTEIKKAIKEEGKENFTKEILKIFSTRDEIINEERKLVTIDIVRSSNSYNMTLGGGSPGGVSTGYVVCRPINALEKVIRIPRNEYYKNRNLYIITGNINNKKHSKNKEIIGVKQLPKTSTADCGRTKYVNIETLEVVEFIGKDKPDNLYSVWYPYYFIDKSNNKFISKEYLLSEYKKFHNFNKIATKFKIGRTSLDKIVDYYNIKQELYDSAIPPRGHFRTNGFSGKIFVHKGLKQTIINNDELDDYLSKGYIQGKITNNVDYDKLYEFYVSGNSVRSCLEHFKTSNKNIKRILGITSESVYYQFHSDKLQKTIGLFITNEKMLNDVLNHGWELGKRQYPKEKKQ